MSDRIKIPIIQEEAHVTKRELPAERVSVQVSAETSQVLVEESLQHEQIVVKRVRIDREVQVVPEIRTEGNTTIIPVFEERLVVEKRLFLVEEIQLCRSVQVETVGLPAELRRTRVDIERETLDAQENKG